MKARAHIGDTKHFQPLMNPLKDQGHTAPKHLPNGSFQIKQRNAHSNQRHKVRNQKDATSIFIDQIREPPKGSIAGGETYQRHKILSVIVINVGVVGVVGLA